jgi:RNA polymerase-associated protein RTF1
MIVEGFKMPTKSTLLRKNQDIHRLLNHQFTKEELDEKLRRQGANDNKMLVFDRIQLERRRQLAIAAGDEAAIAECDAELAKLTGPKLAFGTALVKPRTAENTQQDRLEEINRRNQKLNTENIRKAQLEERKRERMAAAAVARGEALPDRFARVKTRARTHYDVNGDRLTPVKRPDEDGSGISRSVTPQPPSTAGANTPKRTSTPKPAGPTSAVKNGAKEPKGVPTIRHRPYDDEVIGALDFDIDIEL